jgi:copper transport protein
MLMNRIQRRYAALAAVVLALAVAIPVAAHTELISATPKPNSAVPAGPIAVRLVFGEPVEGSLATIVITGSDSVAQSLRVKGDPHDVHAVIADVTLTAPGTYRMKWHVVSADGHPVNGSYRFTVGSEIGNGQAGVATDSAAAVDHAHDSTAMQGMSMADSSDAVDAVGASAPAALPLRAVALRAGASFAVLALAGMLTMITWLLPSTIAYRRARARIRWLAITAFALCIAHALSWSLYATGGAGGSAALDALLSQAGRGEMLRVLMVALTLWSLFLVRNTKAAAVCAIGAMLATAGIGHSAAISPGLLIPIKALHLASAALWLGGLLMLWNGIESDDERGAGYMQVAMRVSVAALTAVVIIAITGIAQTLLVITLHDLLTSSYGLLSLGKVGVLVVLMGFGAANRLRNVPAVQRGEAIHTLRRTVAWEIAVVAIAFVLAGALAYTAPPEQTHHQTGSQN